MRCPPVAPRFQGLFTDITPPDPVFNAPSDPGEAPFLKAPTDILALSERPTPPDFGVPPSVEIRVSPEQRAIAVIGAGPIGTQGVETVTDFIIASALAVRGVTASYAGPLTQWAKKEDESGKRAREILEAMMPKSPSEP